MASTSKEDSEHAAWRRLLGARGIGVSTARSLVGAFGSAVAACSASVSLLQQKTGSTMLRARRMYDSIINVDLEREESWLASHRGHLISLDSPGYPRSLLPLPDPPGLLRVQGDLPDSTTPCIAVIGTRRCSVVGLQEAGRVARGLVEAGCCIVSGGARGIDSESHRMAVRCGGRTVAVLGSGLACRYPPEHDNLFDSILDSGGAILSELPVHQEPRPGFFPRRNRIISGLALGVVVIEAPVRSGAMITARLAVEEHGRDAMMMPGPPSSMTHQGCHRAVQQGWAHLVTSAEDVLSVLMLDYMGASALCGDHAGRLLAGAQQARTGGCNQ